LSLSTIHWLDFNLSFGMILTLLMCSQKWEKTTKNMKGTKS
jgi:hypothetical protein